uniref:Glycine-rich RNA-binding protein 4-like n=1 Tax=Rhizophora mucronata TaxID=61149 RepID=A0A2P2L3D2_RHIMU
MKGKVEVVQKRRRKPRGAAARDAVALIAMMRITTRAFS